MTASPLTDISLVQAQLAARITALCAPCGLFPVEPAAHDFTALSIRCEAVIGAVKGFLLQAVEHAAANEPGNEVRDAELAASIDAHLTDLSGDITGTLERIAQRVREDRYGGVTARGAMYRARGVR